MLTVTLKSATTKINFTFMKVAPETKFVPQVIKN